MHTLIQLVLYLVSTSIDLKRLRSNHNTVSAIYLRPNVFTQFQLIVQS